ncbi:MAG: hypothetical protein JWR02_1085 [Mucilaginibacter sp.]|nr:hypothetical protein [Mucilaginibacter sp.]
MGAIQIVARIFTHPDDADVRRPSLPSVKRVFQKNIISLLPQPSFWPAKERVVQRSADRVS